MKILVLAHGLRAAGGRVVAVNLLQSLKRIDEINQYCCVVPNQPEYQALALETKRHEVHYYQRAWGHPGRLLFDSFSIKRISRAFHPDVIVGLGNLGLINPRVPQAVLIMHPYLVYELKNIGYLPPAERMQVAVLRHRFKRQLPATDLIFCQTATMEARLRSRYGYHGETVITKNALAPFPPPGPYPSKLPAKLARYAGKYKLFYLTRYYPHKGLEVLVEMMDTYRDRLSDVVAVITIDAAQHRNAAVLLRHIKARKLHNHVVNVGPLAKQDLPAYYAACDCLVMPTRLESFSSSYLEAMHFGLPILTSDRDFAREICGDAARYFDPCSAGSIAEAVLALRENPDLKPDLVARGKLCLASYQEQTWDDIAGNMLSALERMVDAHSSLCVCRASC